ncbi:MAG: monofunctional biosynthetic peptidoglycan transglycosylase [Alphaproteobacteria bacterium]
MKRKAAKRRLLKSRWFRWLAAILLLPYVLTLVYIIVPPPSTLMLADIATLHWPKRDWVPISRMAPVLVRSVIVAEDSAFCSHTGFDWKQIERNLDKAIDGKRYGGASTITQQTVKNLFLWNGRSWVRKVIEAPITLWMELVLSKRRILEIYLNTAEWGPHIYGVGAASRHHFGTDATSLSASQASLLAATLPNPKVRRPSRPTAFMKSAAGVIAGRASAHRADITCLY